MGLISKSPAGQFGVINFNTEKKIILGIVKLPLPLLICRRSTSSLRHDAG